MFRIRDGLGAVWTPERSGFFFGFGEIKLKRLNMPCMCEFTGTIHLSLLGETNGELTYS